VHVAGDLVLLHQTAPEEKRVVRPERYRDPGRDERPEGNSGLIRGNPERHVGGRAHLARDALRGEPLNEPGILHRPDSVPEPVRVQHVQAGRHAGRPDKLPGVRHEQQPGPLSDPERRRKIRGGPPPLVVGEPEPDHALPGILRRQPRKRPGIHRVPGPVGGDDDPDPDVSGPRRLLGRVKHQLGKRGNPAVHRREPGGIGLQLQPPGPLSPLIFRDLPH
jgi:hypothetical protein